jgi:hypothetical protein
MMPVSKAAPEFRIQVQADIRFISQVLRTFTLDLSGLEENHRFFPYIPPSIKSGPVQKKGASNWIGEGPQEHRSLNITIV